jgi:hypothetical protein
VAVSRQTADKWLRARTAGLSAPHATKVARFLNVRASWLIDGDLPVQRMSGDAHAARALMLMERLPKDQLEHWFALGEEMAE